MDDFLSFLLTLWSILWPLIVFTGVMAVLGYVMGALGLMLTLKKLNLPGWGAWIPFYNLYLLLKIGKQREMWFWVFIASQALSIIPAVGTLIDIAGKIFLIILYVYAAVNINKTFENKDRTVALTIFALLLPPIWLLTVGLRDTKPRKVSGPVFLDLKTDETADK